VAKRCNLAEACRRPPAIRGCTQRWSSSAPVRSAAHFAGARSERPCARSGPTVYRFRQHAVDLLQFADFRDRLAVRRPGLAVVLRTLQPLVKPRNRPTDFGGRATLLDPDDAADRVRLVSQFTFAAGELTRRSSGSGSGQAWRTGRACPGTWRVSLSAPSGSLTTAAAVVLDACVATSDPRAASMERVAGG